MAPRAVGMEFDFFLSIFGENMAEPTSGLIPYFVAKESKNVGRAQGWPREGPGMVRRKIGIPNKNRKKMFFCIFGSLREYCVGFGQNTSLVQNLGRKKLSRKFFVNLFS